MMGAYEKALRALRFEEVDHVPVVLPLVGAIYARLAGIPDEEYYADPATMLDAQIWFYEQIADVFTFPGIWPDFGAVAELGGMGARIVFSKDAPPYLHEPVLRDVKEIAGFQPPDPRKAEFTAKNLEYLKYFQQHLPDKLRKKYGFMDGHLFCGGPGEIAALMLGYEKFFYGIYDFPELIHELLRKVTDFIKAYLRAQIEIVGPPRRIYVWDHLPGMLNYQIYAQFVHPYLYEVFEFVKEAEIRLYHNENNYPHLLDLISELPCNVCHIGPKHDLSQSKTRLKKCVMGNLHPIVDLLQASEEELRHRCKTMIKTAGQGGGLWLSTAGGMAPETGLERIKIIINVANETHAGDDRI
ncbi:uroporphyrinogen decarboxylase family protein [Neomoorella mulderi]|nr:uroporphyrinogen decarboxylase family protein [Moorella mulderi]